MVFCYGNLKMTKTGIYYILSKKSSKLVAINSMGFFNKYMKKQYEIMQTLVKFLNLEVKGKNTNIFQCCLQSSTVNHNKSIGTANK